MVALHSTQEGQYRIRLLSAEHGNELMQKGLNSTLTQLIQRRNFEKHLKVKLPYPDYVTKHSSCSDLVCVIWTRIICSGCAVCVFLFCTKYFWIEFGHCSVVSLQHKNMPPKTFMKIFVTIAVSIFVFFASFLSHSFPHKKPSFRRLHEDRPSLTETDIEVLEMLSKIDNLVTKATFNHFNYTTSPGNSRATITNSQDKYCIGDHLTIRLDMFDYLGNRKAYGGDFLRARIHSPEIGAGASGSIKDFNNGSYLVNFTLFWEGNVKISLMLFHSSEGVSALWRARNKGYEYIRFTGTFNNVTQNVRTECGFNINTTKELCEYRDQRDGEFFYCIRPEHVPCEAFTHLMSNNRQRSHLTDLEKELFLRSGIGTEIKKEVEIIHVHHCNRTTSVLNETCKIGMKSPVPGGYFLKNKWKSSFCALSSSTATDMQMDKCLRHKMIYLMGDSTLRQWIEYFGSMMKSLQFFDLHESGPHQSLLALDMGRNLKIQWKKHGHPFVTVSLYTVKNHAYLPREIDLVSGDAHTSLVITLGQHFRPFPIAIFIRRAINVRKAVLRLLIRSPDTKVIVKLENTREKSPDVERFSDFHGYLQNLALSFIFQDMNVGIIDAWDMTTAYGAYSVHPPKDVIASQVNMFLTYIC
ncbi:NXPE family member 1-like [Lissotriton helveticus]